MIMATTKRTVFKYSYICIDMCDVIDATRIIKREAAINGLRDDGESERRRDNLRYSSCIL
jgi:hypothetical protein